MWWMSRTGPRTRWAVRGAPGVPTLYGGWFHDGALSYVVQRAGVPLMRDGVFHPSWDAAARDSGSVFSGEKSATLMKSILRCFAAFAGAGFYESDLKVHQFAFEPRTLRVYLIDAPRSFRSGLAEFYNNRSKKQTPRPVTSAIKTLAKAQQKP